MNKLLLSVSSSGAFAPPDHLLFLHRSDLLARRFDPVLGEWLGETFRMAEDVGSSVSSRTDLSVSSNGILIYGRDQGRHQLAWLDRRGRTVSKLASPAHYLSVSLSRDHKSAAASRIDPDTRRVNLWLIDTSDGRETRLTDSTANDRFPVWSPDGARLVFASDRRGGYDLFQRTFRGGKDDLLLGDVEGDFPTDWSRDGKLVAFQRQSLGETQIDIWIEPRTGGRIRPIRDGLANERQASFSPDGLFLAYVSDESFFDEVYLTSLYGRDEERMISEHGGYWPSFRGDSKEIYYVAPDGWLMAKEIDTVFQGLDEREARALFPIGWDATSLVLAKPYAAASDGQRFLVSMPVTQSWPMEYTVVVNALSEVEN